MDLYQIKNPKFLKSLNEDELYILSNNIREFLINSISKTGGHLSSNLGIVELTIALHYVFDSPNDKLLFDVGHQAYTHKILTGRTSLFNTLRQYNGLSGFLKFNESPHDIWEAGHSSTSLSGALGLSLSRDLNNEKHHIIPIIGDGALINGMALEALNHIGHIKSNMIIIFNDNEMSISQNIGGITKSLTKLRTSKSYNTLKNELKERLDSNIGKPILSTMKKIKNILKDDIVDSGIFKEFDLEYFGPVDGHNFKELIEILNVAKNHQGPIVIHVKTKKGKGYKYAENDRSGKWHGIAPFNPLNGQLLSSLPINHLNWSSIISNTLIRLAKENPNIVCITPAMIEGSKLQDFFNKYPNRSFDCGIAESHAITLAAGLSKGNKIPFVSIYSSFLQRAYDQINHDLCRMNLPCVIGIDRAGLVGEDGETHHGVFDISILKSLPNIVIGQPKDANQAQDMLYTAINSNRVFAIRYPRGSVIYQEKEFNTIEIGKWYKEIYLNSNDLTIITYGNDISLIYKEIKNNKYKFNLINSCFFKPIDYTIIDELVRLNKPVLVYETDILSGGLTSIILEYLCDSNQYLNIYRIGIKDEYIVAGSMNDLKKVYKLDIKYIIDKAKSIVNSK